MKENKTKKEIEALYKKIAPLQNKAIELEEEEVLRVQRPRMKKLVGTCLRSIYGDDSCAKILDLIETKKNTLFFILEICSINDEGNPYLHLDNSSPYLNKEWWNAEIPLSGWKKCTEEEYLQFKAKVVSEFGSQKSLRKWINKLDY